MLQVYARQTQRLQEELAQTKNLLQWCLPQLKIRRGNPDELILDSKWNKYIQSINVDLDFRWICRRENNKVRFVPNKSVMYDCLEFGKDSRSRYFIDIGNCGSYIIPREIYQQLVGDFEREVTLFLSDVCIEGRGALFAEQTFDTCMYVQEKAEAFIKRNLETMEEFVQIARSFAKSEK